MRGGNYPSACSSNSGIYTEQDFCVDRAPATMGRWKHHKVPNANPQGSACVPKYQSFDKKGHLQLCILWCHGQGAKGHWQGEVLSTIHTLPAMGGGGAVNSQEPSFLPWICQIWVSHSFPPIYPASRCLKQQRQANQSCWQLKISLRCQGDAPPRRR